jgi:hypothetical protein
MLFSSRLLRTLTVAGRSRMVLICRSYACAAVHNPQHVLVIVKRQLTCTSVVRLANKESKPVEPPKGFCDVLDGYDCFPAGIPYSQLSIGVPKERFTNERRVALSPSAVQMLVKKGFKVQLETGAGAEAKFANIDYEAAGAKIVTDAYTADIVLKVRPPLADEVGRFKEGNTLISFLYPAQNGELVNQLAARKMTVFAMDAIPRISRAQVCLQLSAQTCAYVGVRCTVVDGEHQWLQGGRRGGEQLWPVLHRSDHRRWQSASRQSAHHWRRRGRIVGDWNCTQYGWRL